MRIHSSILAWRVPWTEEPGGPQSTESEIIRHDWAAKRACTHSWRCRRCCSVAQLCLTLRPHELQHARAPWRSPYPRVFPSSCSLHWWCPPVISSATLFFCPQSFPAPETFPMSHLFISNDKNAGSSASASVLPLDILVWSPLRWTGLVFLLSKGLSGVFSSTTVWRHLSLAFCLLYSPALTTMHDTRETIALVIQTFVSRVMFLLFYILFRFVTAFPPRSNCLLISWLQSLSVVTLEPKKRKSVTTSTFSPSICHAVMGLDVLTICDPMGYSLPGSSVHGIFQARILECIGISSPGGSSWPWDRTLVSCIARRILYHWATWEAPLHLLPPH